MENSPISKNFATLSIHCGKNIKDDCYCCVVPPIVPSVNFKVHFPAHQECLSQEYTYSKKANPTRDNLEKCLATLEGGKYGVCFASGCGVLSSFLTVLKRGSHIICSNSIFGGTMVLLDTVAKSFGFTTSFVDIYNLENLNNAIQLNTALIWVESISNPLMKVANIKNISKIAKERDVLLAVDNTFLTPYFHRPLELGADAVSQSITKYINGHCDISMGAIVVNRKDIYDKLKFTQNSKLPNKWFANAFVNILAMGVIPSPMDCAQVLRSLKTLSLRMKQHNINAIKVAQYLESHKKITKVVHPGLPSHPQHDLFMSQTTGHSGLISFCIDGDLEQTKTLLNSFKLITPAASFGAIESLVEIPMLMSQSVVPKELRNPDVTGNLVRLSVGLEDEDDIIQDLKQALDCL